MTQLLPEATTIFKDSYLFDVLALPKSHSEADLQTALVANLRRFLIELGRDFCFVGEPRMTGESGHLLARRALP